MRNEAVSILLLQIHERSQWVCLSFNAVWCLCAYLIKFIASTCFGIFSGMFGETDKCMLCSMLHL